MSRACFQPVGQKRLTNIAVVRLKKNGQRFEIACYQNKVKDWRNGIEKDLDEVLQTETVYTNVSKGVLAKDKELQEAFGTTDHHAICIEILGKGELQVSDKERKMEFDNLFKDVAGVLVEKCVNPETSRPYTMTMLERALRDIHFNVDPKKSAKQQALEALPLLQERFPIQRARMRLKVSVPAGHADAVEAELRSREALIEGSEAVPGGEVALTAQVEPGLFRDLHAFLSALAGGAGRLEVLSLAVQAEGASADQFAAAAAAAAGRSAAAFAAAASTSAPPGCGCGGGDGDAGAASSSSPAAAAARGMSSPAALQKRAAQREAAEAGGGGGGGGGGEVVYACGPISDLPEAHASRKERFAELDTLQPGWRVELRTKGDTIEAVFFHPSGEKVGAYANARRQALAWHKANAS